MAMNVKPSPFSSFASCTVTARCTHGGQSAARSMHQHRDSSGSRVLCSGHHALQKARVNQVQAERWPQRVNDKTQTRCRWTNPSADLRAKALDRPTPQRKEPDSQVPYPAECNADRSSGSRCVMPVLCWRFCLDYDRSQHHGWGGVTLSAVLRSTVGWQSLCTRLCLGRQQQHRFVMETHCFDVPVKTLAIFVDQHNKTKMDGQLGGHASTHLG